VAIPRLALQEALLALKRESSALRNFIADHSNATDEQIRSKYAAVDDAIAAVDGIMSGEGETTSFSGFLEGIGKSLVNAQQQLDVESGKYLSQIGDRDYVQPSVFRIPTVTASMKFAFEKVNSEQVNLIFYRRTQQAKEQHQQSLTFELASAPPPPEVTARLKRAMPSIGLVLVPLDRARMLDALAPMPPLTRKIDRPLVLIWPAGGDREFFFARALKSDAEKKAGVWHGSFAGEQPVVQAVVPFTADVPPSTRLPLRDWILKLAAAQAKFLGSLS